MTINHLNELDQFKKIAGIYCFTDKLNNRIYIGQTINIYRRIVKEHSKGKGEQHFNYIIKKYGLFNRFNLEILHWWDEKVNNDDISALETAFIDEYKSLIEFGGYNICLFGNNNSGIKRTEEHKVKYSKCKLGIPRSEETKRRMSETKKGQYLGDKNPFYGKKHTDETKEKISKSHLGKKQSKETRERISKNSTKKRSIKQINAKTNEVIKIWDSISDAARGLNIPGCHGGISAVCKKQKYYYTAGGFKWEYA